jgi:hypothetical protein
MPGVYSFNSRPERQAILSFMELKVTGSYHAEKTAKSIVLAFYFFRQDSFAMAAQR